MKKITIILVLTLSANSVFALDWLNSTKVTSVYPWENGEVIVTFDKDHTACAGTHNPKRYTLAANTNGVTDTGFKNMYSLMLSAAATGASMHVAFTPGAGNTCLINRILVSY